MKKERLKRTADIPEEHFRILKVEAKQRKNTRLHALAKEPPHRDFPFAFLIIALQTIELLEIRNNGLDSREESLVSASATRQREGWR